MGSGQKDAMKSYQMAMKNPRFRKAALAALKNLEKNRSGLGPDSSSVLKWYNEIMRIKLATLIFLVLGIWGFPFPGMSQELTSDLFHRQSPIVSWNWTMPHATLIIFSLKFKFFIASLSSLRWRYPRTILNFGSISCRAVPTHRCRWSLFFQ